MKIRNVQIAEKRGISFLIIVVLLIFVVNATAQEQITAPEEIADTNPSNNKEFESQLEELMTTLYCPCGCVRETNKSCVCATAQTIETDFRNRLSAGETVEEIRTEYLTTHGPQFSAVMKAEGVNLIAYLMPVVILLAIGGVIFIVRHQSRENKTAQAQPNQQATDELQQMVESELKKYKEQS